MSIFAMIFFGACGAAILVSTAGLAVLFLFTEFSPVPPTLLSVLALIAIGIAKVFGAACFAYAGSLWVRLGGLATAVVCGSVTAIAFSITLGQPVGEYDIAWHYTDRLLGLAPGTIKPVYGTMLAIMMEAAGVVLLNLFGPHTQRHPQAAQPASA